MVFVLYIIFNPIRAFAGQDPGKTSLKKIVALLNEPSETLGSPLLISLKENTALIGFSKSASTFTCNYCLIYYESYSFGSDSPTEESLYTIQGSLSIPKPSVSECAGKACVCLCDDLIFLEPQSQITCRFMACKTLSSDISESTSLYTKLAPNEHKVTSPTWKHGFFFERNTIIHNGVPVADDQMLIYIQRKKSGESLYSTACPKLPCIQQN